MMVEQITAFSHCKSESSPMKIEHLSSGLMIVLWLARENVIEVRTGKLRRCGEKLSVELAYTLWRSRREMNNFFFPNSEH